MLKKFLALLCVFSLSCASWNYKREAYNSIAMIKFESIDPVTKDDSYITGTAFAVDENYLITAAHVCIGGVQEIVLKNVENFSVYLIYLDKDESVSIKKDFKIVDLDKENDLCLIYKKHHGLKPVILSSRELKIRESVFVVGAPASNFPVEADGYVALPSINAAGDDRKWSDGLLMSLDIYGGNSGGPVFDKNGYVIGVVVAGSHKYLHVGIAVKSKYVLQFLKHYSDSQVKVQIREK